MVPTFTVPKLRLEGAVVKVVEDLGAPALLEGPPPHALLAMSISVRIVRNFTMERIRLLSKFLARMDSGIRRLLFGSYRAVSAWRTVVNRCQQCIGYDDGRAKRHAQ